MSSPDHALDHRTLGSAVLAVENKLGLGSGSAAANFILVGSGAGTSSWLQTWNNGTLGTPSITGGTINNATFGTTTINNGTLGTPTITGGTASGVTIGSTSILQPLNSAFWAHPGTANQILGTNQLTKINFGTIVYDLLSEFDTANSWFIAKQAGLYQFTSFVNVQGLSNSLSLQFQLNGTTQQGNYPGIANAGGWVFWQGSVPTGGTITIVAFNNDVTHPGTVSGLDQGTASLYGKRVY